MQILFIKLPFCLSLKFILKIIETIAEKPIEARVFHFFAPSSLFSTLLEWKLNLPHSYNKDILPSN